jgi:hypothetical protein
MVGDMEEEEFTVCCPKCSCTISFDDAGDAFVKDEVALPRGQYRSGRRSLVVEDADPTWREREYFRNQGNNNLTNALSPLTSFSSQILDETPPKEPVDPDPLILEAVHKDLQDRGFN